MSQPASIFWWLAVNWKGILTGVGGALVVILQIIQVIIGNHIETTLETKTDTLAANGDKLRQLLAQNGSVSRSNTELIKSLHDEIHRIEQEMAAKK